MLDLSETVLKPFNFEAMRHDQSQMKLLAA
jgi:hypothetical protein